MKNEMRNADLYSKVQCYELEPWIIEDFFLVMCPDLGNNKCREITDFLIHLLGKDISIQNEGYWNLFKAGCKKCVTWEAYLPICRFMKFIFQNSYLFDPMNFEAVLKEIQVRNDYNLAELCADYFSTFILCDEFDKMRWDDITNATYDFYTALYKEKISFTPINDYTDDECTFFCKKLYGTGFDVSRDVIHSTEEIDHLVDRIKEAAAGKNNSRPYYSSLVVMISLISVISYLEHVDNRYYCKETEVSNLSLCHYIYNKYVFKPLSEISPEDYNEIAEIRVIKPVMRSLFDYYEALLLWHGGPGSTSWTISSLIRYDEAAFEFAGKTDKPVLESARELFKETKETVYALYQIIQTEVPFFSKILSSSCYEKLISILPVMMYVNGLKRETAEFLVIHYDEIPADYKRRGYMQVLISRGILETQQLSIANTLYGYISHEMCPEESVSNKVYIHIQELYEYLKDVKAYLAVNRFHPGWHEVDYYKVVFEDHDLINNLMSDLELVLTGQSKDTFDFRVADLVRVYSVIDALSDDRGIHLGRLKIDVREYSVLTYDKLENGLSYDLIKRGKLLLSNMHLYKHYLDKLKTNTDVSSLWNKIDIYLHDKIYALQQQSLEDKIQAIAKLRETADELDGPDRIQQELDMISNSIMRPFQNLVRERVDIEMKVKGLYDDFVMNNLKDYRYPTLVDAISGRFEKIMDYLITSEIVYELLRQRTTAVTDKALDYSPALIPLTKALEYVLNSCFSRMNVHSVRLQDVNTKVYFDKSNNVKQGIELGPCAFLFRTYKHVSVINGANNINYIDQLPKSLFYEWDGDQIFDIGILKKLDHIQMRFETNNVEVSVPFTSDDMQNLHILFLSILHISNNYRNVVAHKDPVTDVKYTECKNLMIQSENLLWIILNMIKKPA